MRSLLAFVAPLLALSVAHARLGETEAEMTARFGAPGLRSHHSIFTEGKFRELGPTLNYRQDDWHIRADLVEGRCVRISYSKPGEWSEEQFALVLAYNSQGVAWKETSQVSLKRMKRTWLRSDGAEATWSRGMGFSFTTPAYARAKEIAEAKAKAASRQMPKI